MAWLEYGQVVVAAAGAAPRVVALSERFRRRHARCGCHVAAGGRRQQRIAGLQMIPCNKTNERTFRSVSKHFPFGFVPSLSWQRGHPSFYQDRLGTRAENLRTGEEQPLLFPHRCHSPPPHAARLPSLSSHVAGLVLFKATLAPRMLNHGTTRQNAGPACWEANPAVCAIAAADSS